LSADEKIYASIPCVGFDGFPDWGCDGLLDERQQRIGHCVLAIIGSASQFDDKSCRIVMIHSGRMRGISAKEMNATCCCAGQNSASWDIERRQDSAIAVVSMKTQLVAVSSEQLDRLSISKASGSHNKCYYLLILLLPLMVMLMPFIIGMAIGFVFLYGWLILLSIIVYLLKMICMGKSWIFGVEAAENQELLQLIMTSEEYKTTVENVGFGTTSKSKGRAELLQFNYRAISLFCADPCTDRTIEVIAVVQPSVSSDEIARFVLFADQHKMDRSSASVHDLTFVAHSRALRNAAKHGDSYKEKCCQKSMRYTRTFFVVLVTGGLAIPYWIYKLACKNKNKSI
jgi:hypothetical protein